MDHIEDNREKMLGVFGTLIFHALVILLLLVGYLTSPRDNNLTEWGGVPVMFGNVADAYGNDEPLGGGGKLQQGTIIPPMEDEVVAPAYTPTTKSNNETEPIATQDFEETLALSDADKKNKERKKQEDIAEQNRKVLEQKAVAERRAAEARASQQKAEGERINSQMAGLFGNGTAEGQGSRGNTQGEGIQGVPTGNASYGKTSGIGGWGSFDLGGRSLGSAGLIRPNYADQDYGTVVVDIVVNPQGQVVESSIGRGTNTASAVLKQEALRAAKKTKFNIVNKAGNQKGTITYKFNLN